MTLDEAKKAMVKFVELKTTLRPAFVDPILKAEEVKHGHWVDSGYMNVGHHCSLCGGYVVAGKGKYCPHCGARMDEVEE